MATAPDLTCDLAIVGGGLAGCLAALAMRRARPEVRLLLIEAADTLGGNHVWSFFDSDVAEADRPLVAPLIAHRWQGYDIAFPAHRRMLAAGYQSITSERLDAVVRDALPPGAVLTGCPVAGVTPTRVTLADGRDVAAAGVIDARGGADVSFLDCGWQKFVGQELRLTAPHGLVRPVVMDATVAQVDGYRFVYLLPFAPDRIFVEDTYYSDTPALDRDRLAGRIAEYGAARGWQVAAVEREESGALPVTIGGDFVGYWRSGGAGIAKIGVRAGLFHPTTGYSLPDAVRTARLLTTLDDLSGAALHDRLHDHARDAWNGRGFYRLLDRMLFRAAEPDARYRVLERFYRLSPGLIGRFYAARSSRADMLRTLAGKPPVPFWRGVRVALAGIGAGGRA